MKKDHREKYKRSVSPAQQQLLERRHDIARRNEKALEAARGVDPVVRKSRPTTSIIRNEYLSIFNKSVEKLEKSREAMNVAKERAVAAEVRANNSDLTAKTVLQDMETDHLNAQQAHKMAKTAFETDKLREEVEQEKLRRKLQKYRGESESIFTKAFNKEYKKQEAKRGAEAAIRQSEIDQAKQKFKDDQSLLNNLRREIESLLDGILSENLTPEELQTLLDGGGCDLTEIDAVIESLLPDCPRKEGMLSEIRDVLALFEQRRSDIVNL